MSVLNNDQSFKLIVTPKFDVTTAPVVDIVVVADLFELTEAIKRETPIVSIDNMRLLELLVRNADLFKVKLVNMIGLPTADYSPAYDQIVWELDRISYDAMSAELATSDLIESVKSEEKRRFGQRPLKPKNQSQSDVTEEDVAKMRVPRGVDIIGDADA